MVTFEKAVEAWADIVNEWYDLKATPEEIIEVFNRDFKDRRTYDDYGDPDGSSYVEVFFKARDGGWSPGLDTADREEFADSVEQLRGNPPLPTYADLGGTLLNKVPSHIFWKGGA
jgi:Zn-dependent oligopeptidase